MLSFPNHKSLSIVHSLISSVSSARAKRTCQQKAERQLELACLVATNRTAIVATLVPFRDSFVQTIRGSFGQQIEPSVNWLNYNFQCTLFQPR